MKTNILVTKYDLLTDDVEVLADGLGHFQNGKLTYYELNDPVTKHEIIFLDDRIYLRRFSEIESETELLVDEKGMCKVVSPYGVMVLESKLLVYERKEDMYMVEYQIYQEKELISHQKITWKIK
ncbi:MAG: DUF1934 family protein [Solobacterium sp.]|nr:DUF1934 family protein [Solobacterium sp.]